MPPSCVLLNECRNTRSASMGKRTSVTLSPRTSLNAQPELDTRVQDPAFQPSLCPLYADHSRAFQLMILPVRTRRPLVTSRALISHRAVAKWPMALCFATPSTVPY